MGMTTCTCDEREMACPTHGVSASLARIDRAERERLTREGYFGRAADTCPSCGASFSTPDDDPICDECHERDDE